VKGYSDPIPKVRNGCYLTFRFRQGIALTCSGRYGDGLLPFPAQGSGVAASRSRRQNGNDGIARLTEFNVRRTEGRPY